MTATKSTLGHTFGAAGAMAALAAVLGIRDDVLTPTINYETPDPECDFNLVANEARQARIGTALVNAFGFGGQNVVLVVKRPS